MYITTLIEKLKRRGFERHAVLLEHRHSWQEYSDVLSNPDNYYLIKEEMGEDIADYFKRYGKLKGKSLERRIVIPKERQPYHGKPSGVKSLRIRTGKPATLEDIEKASEITEGLEDLTKEAAKIIYSYVKEVTGDNPDLIYEIYADQEDDYVSQFIEQADETGYLRRNLEHFLKELKEDITKDNVSLIIRNKCSMLINRISDFEWDPEEDTYDLADRVIRKTESILNDETEYKNNIEGFHKTKRERVMRRGKQTIDVHVYGEKREIEDKEVLYRYEDIRRLWGKAFFMGADYVMEKDLKEKAEELQYYEHVVSDYKKVLVGLQQILEGSPVTNPNAGKLSILQNDARLPNIQYPEEVKEKLAGIIEEFSSKMDELPEISNLAISSKLKRREYLNYSVKEMVKHPLDITFGNDSGCCIFVPKKAEEMGNGYSVPYYLNNPNIRLFEVDRGYKADGKNKHKRVGLVVAFETADDEHPEKRILACNSLELSNFGVPGGRKKIKRLVDYVEDWLVKYAQEFGYDGVVMGNHGYNTSRNYSSRDREIVEERLDFAGEFSPFYSDIFDYDRENGTISTKQNSCYWLWRKE